jgi:hypothetical protein
MTPLAAALSDYVLLHGLEHDDPDCPQDDTCECPTYQAVSRALDADRKPDLVECFECRATWSGAVRAPPRVTPTCSRCGKLCASGHWIIDPEKAPGMAGKVVG